MKSFREQLKLTKPGIALLLDLVALTTFSMGLRNLDLIWKVGPLLFAGTAASFSSSLLNNFIDMDIDNRMKRTSWRSKYANNRAYILSISLLLLSSMIITVIFLNVITAVWIISGFLSYSILYTLILKRNTQWNIVIGGIAGSFPALAGWSSVNTPISFASLFVAIIVFLWTPTHFWSLAIKYRDDYSKAGVPMMPSMVPEKRAVQYILANTIVLGALSMTPIFFDFGFPSTYKFVIIPLTIYLLYEVSVLYPKRGKELAKSAIKAFLASNWYLTGVLIGIIIGEVVVLA